MKERDCGLYLQSLSCNLRAVVPDALDVGMVIEGFDEFFERGDIALAWGSSLGGEVAEAGIFTDEIFTAEVFFDRLEFVDGGDNHKYFIGNKEIISP